MGRAQQDLKQFTSSRNKSAKPRLHFATSGCLLSECRDMSFGSLGIRFRLLHGIQQPHRCAMQFDQAVALQAGKLALYGFAMRVEDFCEILRLQVN